MDFIYILSLNIEVYQLMITRITFYLLSAAQWGVLQFSRMLQK